MKCKGQPSQNRRIGKSSAKYGAKTRHVQNGTNPIESLRHSKCYDAQRQDLVAPKVRGGDKDLLGWFNREIGWTHDFDAMTAMR